MSNLIYWNFNVFAFSSVVANSFNTLPLWCEYRINHCIEFITGQNCLLSLPSHGNLYPRCRNNVWSLIISNYSHKTNELWIESSNTEWTKRMDQENVSLSLAKRKLAEKKNEWKFSNQSVEVIHASYLQKIGSVIEVRFWIYNIEPFWGY